MTPIATDSADKRMRRGQRHDARRTQIVDDAMALLLRYGNHGTTMDQIANATGVSTASLYKYFPLGKDELYEALIDRALDADEEILERAVQSSDVPLGQLTELAAQYVRFGLEYPGFFQFVAQPEVFGPLTESQAERIASRAPRTVDRVAAIVARGQRDDIPDGQRFARHLDPARTAQVLHGAWSGLLAMLRNDPLEVTAAEFEALSKLATEIVKHGIMSR